MPALARDRDNTLSSVSSPLGHMGQHTFIIAFASVSLQTQAGYLSASHSSEGFIPPVKIKYLLLKKIIN